MSDFVYVDNNATTQPDEEVVEVVSEAQQQAFASPSSLHYQGIVARSLLDNSRKTVAEYLGVTPGEITFTSGGTESCHLAILGILNATSDRKHIVTSKVEHLAVKGLCERLVKQGYEVSWIDVGEDGTLDLDQLTASIREDTALVSLMAANHETGTVYPVESIGGIVSATNARLHIDACAAAPWMSLAEICSAADAVSISGHKFHGPKGVGAVYVRKGVRLSPMLYGGNQERSRRPGTENLPAIAGMSRAIELLATHRTENTAGVKRLRDRFETELVRTVPECVVNADVEPRLPNTSNISFAYIDGEAILLTLSKSGICASSGSACSTGTVEPSYVLRAMGKPDSLAHGAIRFSFSRNNTDQDVDRMLGAIPPAIEQLRAMSPFWKKKKAERADA